jgi:hypothetical protein
VTIQRAGSRAVRRVLGGAALMLLCAGCAPKRANEIDPTRIRTVDDVVNIAQFWPQTPWLQVGDRIVGFKVTVYFVSGQAEKGVFVPGNIFVWLYELTPTERGTRERKLVHVWQFNESEALGFRVNKHGVMGYYYGFPLRWPTELALEGKLIEIQFGYERTDEQVVLSSARRFRVPVPLGFEPTTQRSEP